MYSPDEIRERFNLEAEAARENNKDALARFKQLGDICAALQAGGIDVSMQWSRRDSAGYQALGRGEGEFYSLTMHIAGVDYAAILSEKIGYGRFVYGTIPLEALNHDQNRKMQAINLNNPKSAEALQDFIIERAAAALVLNEPFSYQPENPEVEMHNGTTQAIVRNGGLKLIQKP